VDVPKHEICEDPQPDGTVDFYGGFRKGPVNIVWKDQPVNWVTNERFRHCCTFTSGPFESMCSNLELTPEGDSGCRADYRLEVSARNLLGRIVLATGFLKKWGTRLDRAADTVRDFLVHRRRDAPFEAAPAPMDEKVASESMRWSNASTGRRTATGWLDGSPTG
jgi:hypothetical protein